MEKKKFIMRMRAPNKQEIEEKKEQIIQQKEESKRKHTPKYYFKRKSYEQVKKRIQGVANEKHRAFIALVYASMGRIGEVVRHKDDRPSNVKNWKNPPISKSDIKRRKTRKGNKLVVIHLRTEKIRRPRVAVIPYDKEKWLADIILDYAKKAPEGYLFNYSTRWGQGVFEIWFNTKNIHVLRHWRITHWLSGEVTGKPVREQIVARMAGHTSLSTQAHHYDHTIFEDYEDEIF